MSIFVFDPELGSRTDAPDSTGSVHAKLTNMIKRAVASNNLIWSNDTVVTTSTDSYIKKKEIVIPTTGVYRISYEMFVTVGDSYGYGQIRLNDVVSVTDSTNATSYATFTRDIECKANDRIQLYLNMSATTRTLTARNLRIAADFEFDTQFQNIL